MTTNLRRPIHFALIGLGRMGANHLRVLKENDACQISVVLDPTFKNILPPLLENTPGIWDPEALSQFKFDCAIIACPTHCHLEMGMKLTGLAKHILMEKPLCCTAREGAELVERARSQSCKLFVGHLERFNPAIEKLKQVLSSGALGKIIHFSFTRVGGHPTEITRENNVLLDLAVHDLDILTQLAGPMFIRSSVCHSSLRKGVYDTAEILLSGKSGISASIHCNWITPTKIRTIRVTGTRGVCFIDYMLQTCSLWGGNLLGQTESSGLNYSDLIEAYRNGDRVDFEVRREEPLKLQLNALIRSIQGQESGLCTGEQATNAVELAETALMNSEKFELF